VSRALPARLGPWQLFAAAIGVAVAQLGMVAMGQGMALGGWGFFAALGIIFVLMLANVMAYAEMALMMPGAGSLSSYAEAALGSLPAILLVFAGYVTPALFGLPVELILVDGILRDVLPIDVPAYTWPCVIVLLFLGLNILGTDVFARVQTTLSYIVLVCLLVTGLVAFSGQGAAPLPAGPDAGWAALGAPIAVTGVLALGFWTFCGLEFVTPLVGEARNPDRDLPRAMIGGLIVIFIAEVVFAAGYLFFVPRAVLLGSATPHLAYVMGVFGPWARIPFAVLALVASSSIINMVIAGVSRMLWGMACNGQVFPLFKYQHPRYGTPVVAMVFVAALPLIGVVWSGGDPNAILSLTVAASVAWILAYVMAQVSLLVLRHRHPHMRRPYRMPFAPLFPLLAIAGMIYVVLNSAPTPELAPVIWKSLGAVLLAFALVGAGWVKFAMKKGWFEPTLPEGAHGSSE